MTKSLVALTPFKIVSFGSNAPLSSPFPLLEALFEACMLNHSQLICHIHNDTLHHLKSLSLRVIFIFWNRKMLERIGQAKMEVVESQKSKPFQELSH
jgi:hypothetical protein